MLLQEAKDKLTQIENQSAAEIIVLFHTFERNSRKLHLAVTERLRKKSKKGKIWKSVSFLTALKNAEYGFYEKQSRSPGGADGIFLLDRNFTPKNEMTQKIFDQYIDKTDSGIDAVTGELNEVKENLSAARLVSHHSRLLGIMAHKENEDWLVLVDYDNTK